jgi:hypothetical protein
LLRNVYGWFVRVERGVYSQTSFIELVHFLFGADARKESIFRSDVLSPWTFDVAADIADETISAARSGAKPSRIFINGPVEGWPVRPQFDERAGLFELSNDEIEAEDLHVGDALAPLAVYVDLELRTTAGLGDRETASLFIEKL